MLAVVWCLVACGAPALAQNVQFNKKAADLGMRSGTRINPSTHALEIEIPLTSYPGRAGVSMPVNITYSSKVWRVAFSSFVPQTQYQQSYTVTTARWAENSSGGWTSTLGMPFVDGMYGNEFYTPTGDAVGTGGCSSPNCFTIDRILMRMPDGSSHEMRSTDEPANCNYPNPCTVPDDMYAVDGSRLRYQKSTQTLFMPDGARYLLGSGQYIDRNGNVLTSGTSGWTDTLGRSIPRPPLGTAAGDFTYTLPGLNGAGMTYVFKWRNLGDPGVLTTAAQLRYVANRGTPSNPATYSPYLFTSEEGSSTYIANAPQLFNPVVLHQVVLPTGRAYTLTYNVYGEIDKVVFPTGGYERYEYGQKLPLSYSNPFYLQGNRGVTVRRVSARGDGSDEVTWTYTQASGQGCPGSACETAPDGTLTARFIHGETNGSFGYSYDGARAGMPYEERAYSAPDASGNRQMLRRKLTEWAQTGTNAVSQWAQQATRNARVTKEVEILLDTGGYALAKTTTYAYDTTYQFSVGVEQTAKNEYGFAPVDPTTAQTGAINSIPTGALIRSAQMTYMTGNASYRARNLLGLVSSVTVKDAAGTTVSQTVTGYDEPAYPLISYGAITSWADPGTNVRGNPTTTSNWNNVAGAYVQTHTQYDQAGSAVNVWDARGYLKQTTYSSAYAYAYPTTATTPAPDPGNTGFGSPTGLVTTTAYDFTTGLITSMTDANNQTTTYEYNDPLNRLSRVNMPDGGRTTYNRVDSHQCGAYVETRTLLDSSGREARAYQFFDGLGRTYLSETYENQDTANPYVRVDTLYDTMNRVWKVSNPYRSSGCTAAANPAGRWTTKAYDDLGRVTSVTTTDGAAVTTAYSGNTTTVTEQSGKKKSSVFDALGRPYQVTEDPGGLNYVTTYTYDTLGNVRKVDQGGQLRFFMYDSLGRLIRVKNPEQDAGSAVSNITDPVTGNTQWSLANGYDDNGNLTARVDARGVTTTYEYDALNRTTKVRYSDGTKDIDRHYDGAVRGKGRFYYFNWDASNNTRFDTHLAVDEYDAAGRPKVYRQHFLTNGAASPAFTVSRTYDLAGHILTQTYPSGRAVSYSYDDMGRPADFAGNLGDGAQRSYASETRYHETGGREQERFGTQTPVYDKQFYNVRGQLSEIRVSTYPITSPGHETDWNRGAILNHYSQAVWGGSDQFNNGNVITQQVWIPADDAISGWTLFEHGYTYDPLNRLKQVRQGGLWQQTYNYDRWGNRTIDAADTWDNDAAWDVPEPQFTASPATNRLAPPAGATMQYDAAGNLTFDNFTGQGARTYDAEGRMTTAQLVAGQPQTAAYTYDADGRRVRRNAGASGEVWQVYGMDNELLAEYAANAAASSPRKEYGYRGGELLVTAEPSAAAQPRLNVADSAQGATASGSTSYDPYGLYAANAINGSRTYAGSYWNDQTAGAFPDWLQVNFSGAKTINEISVFFLQDNYGTAEPTESMTFSQYGITSFDVQYWTGSTWQTVPGGSVSGNNKVWRRFSFPAVTTSAVRVVVNSATDVWSRIVEVEAYTTGAGTAGGTGLPAQYYDNIDYTGALLSRTDANVNFDWGGGSPAASMGADDFSVRWEGKVEPRFSQTYTFYTVTDDGVRLWVNGQLVIDKWIDQGPTEWSGQIALTAGQRYDIRMDFYERGGGATAKLLWSSPSEPKAVIPQHKLFPGGPSSVRWLVKDQVGTPRMVVDQTGSLAGVTRHDYLPFGEELPAGAGGRTTALGYTQADAARQKWAKLERDDETTLDYAKNRYYSSAQGRFTSPDPYVGSGRVIVPQSWNRYTYCINSPLILMDPNGLDWGYYDEGNGSWSIWWFQGKVGKHRGRQYKPLDFGKSLSMVLTLTTGQQIRIFKDNRPHPIESNTNTVPQPERKRDDSLPAANMELVRTIGQKTQHHATFTGIFIGAGIAGGTGLAATGIVGGTGTLTTLSIESATVTTSGAAGDLVVVGGLEETAKFAGMEGYNVLNVAPEVYTWEGVNVPWLDSIIRNGQSVLIRAGGKGTEMEIKYLLDAGYQRIGDLLVPPF